jgi:hypothetical protein
MFRVEGIYRRQICCVVKGKERENGKLGGVRRGNNNYEKIRLKIR